MLPLGMAHPNGCALPLAEDLVVIYNMTKCIWQWTWSPIHYVNDSIYVLYSWSQGYGIWGET